MARKNKSARSKALVSVVMGSDSDWKIMKSAAAILKSFKVPFEAKVVSAHRTPDLMYSFSKEAEKKGIKVIIAGAGGAAHLPGMIASLTVLPVIGVPIQATSLQGQDALLSIVQMPKGVPVATVAIDNSTNAALLAVQILAINDSQLRSYLESYRLKLSEQVLSKRLTTS